VGKAETNSASGLLARASVISGAKSKVAKSASDGYVAWCAISQGAPAHVEAKNVFSTSA
jgi:hypothetical protein